MSIALPERDSQWNGVDETVDLKCPQEEGAEVVKHFREEVPVETNVWC